MRGAGAGFGVGALAFGATVAGLEDVTVFPSLAFAVVSVDEVRALVIVGMTAEDKINAAGFENGEKIGPHVVHAAARVGVFVGVVGAFGVGGMMEEDDDPVAGGGCEIGAEPLRHGAVRVARAVVGIQADEVDVGVIEGIISLGARRNTAGLAHRG